MTNLKNSQSMKKIITSTTEELPNATKRTVVTITLKTKDKGQQNTKTRTSKVLTADNTVVKRALNAGTNRKTRTTRRKLTPAERKKVQQMRKRRLKNKTIKL